jgi:hypothetical protein
MISERSRRPSDIDRAKFFHRSLGASIVFSDKKHDALNELERVI